MIAQARFPSRDSSAVRGLATLFGAVATAVAVTLAAVLAVFFAATVVVVAVLASALLGLAGLAMRRRRTTRRRAPDDIIEARHLGGHSWVAYGWNDPRR